jgi:hypothetical protein
MLTLLSCHVSASAGYGADIQLLVLIRKLDGTVQEEKSNELLTEDNLLDAIFHELREHEDFASSFVITVVVER